MIIYSKVKRFFNHSAKETRVQLCTFCKRRVILSGMNQNWEIHFKVKISLIHMKSSIKLFLKIEFPLKKFFLLQSHKPPQIQKHTVFPSQHRSKQLSNAFERFQQGHEPHLSWLFIPISNTFFSVESQWQFCYSSADFIHLSLTCW